MPSRLFSLLLVVFAAGLNSASFAQGVASQAPQLLTIAGVGPIATSGVARLGISDPSIADNVAPGQRAWMTYSAVAPTERTPAKLHWVVSLRLAYSDDGGWSWKDAGVQIAAANEFGHDAQASSWNNEVSSLVYDPAAPAGERWKLFWHHYLMINGVPRFADSSWIGYKAAATVEGLRTATEIKLFSGKGYDSANNSTDGRTRSPIGGPPLIPIWRIHSELGCIALTEPGAMAVSKSVYLAVSCIEFSLARLGPVAKIVLLRCDAPCEPTRPEAWKFVGTLLTEADARGFGYEKFSGADLFTGGGRAYLLASPVSERPVKGAYNGCYLFRFADLNSGRLEMSDGRPAVVAKIEGAPNSFNGSCTYQPAVAEGGVLYNQVKFGKRPIFQIFVSHRQFLIP